MQVREIMTKTAATVPPTASIEEVAARMRDLDVGFIPVCDGARVVGTITDRDIVVRAVAERADPAKRRVCDAMTPHVIACFEDDSVEDAARLMAEKQVRRIVVLDRDKKAVGVVSLGDLSTRAREEHMPAKTLEAVSRDRALPV